MPTASATDPNTSAVRRRILDSADALFYGQGIRAVSADRIIADAGVSKVTFYRHFKTKDDLVLAYLTSRSQQERQSIEELRSRSAGDPQQVLEQIARVIVELRCSTGFRGCAYINAAAEYPDSRHPIRTAIADHRTWFRGLLADQLRQLGITETAPVVEQLMILRDGAMVTGYLGPQSGRDAGPLIAAGRAVIKAALV